MNDATISVSGNQMFVVFKTNKDTVAKGFHAFIIESKYYDKSKSSEKRNYIFSLSKH